MWFVKWDKKEEFRNRIIIQIFLLSHKNYTFEEYCEGTAFFAKYECKTVLVSLFKHDVRIFNKYNEKYPMYSVNECHVFNLQSDKVEKSGQKSTINNYGYLLIKFIFNKEFEIQYSDYINNAINFLENIISKNLNEKLLGIYRYENIIEDFNLFVYKGDKEKGTKEYEYLQTVINDTLTYMDPTRFNDPFDCDVELENQDYIMKIIYDIISKKYMNKLEKYLPYEKTLEIPYIKEKLDKLILDNINKEIIEEIINFFIKQYLKYNPLDKTVLDRNVIDEMKESIIVAITNFVNVKDKFRVLCMTDKYDDILMWAYYGNSHKGYCFEHSFINIIKGTRNTFKCGICYYGNIKYSIKRPVAKIPNKKYKNFYSFVSIIEEHIDLLFTKFDGWKHEKEFRFVVLTPEIYNNNNKNKYVSINSNVLNYYLGCESKQSNLNDLKSTLKQYNKNTPIYKLKKDKTEYKLI